MLQPGVISYGRKSRGMRRASPARGPRMRAIRQPRTGMLGQRILRAMGAAVHQLATARNPDGKVVPAPEQAQFTFLPGYRGAIE